MNIYLLSHERELLKASNTGRLVKKCLKAQAEIIVWQRKEPNLVLVDLIKQGKVAILSPHDDEHCAQAESTVEFKRFESFIILDSTWQQARKMYNHSEYLQRAPKISLNVTSPSSYKKRRNQLEGGLCTAECVIEILKYKNKLELAAELQKEYDLFNLS